MTEAVSAHRACRSLAGAPTRRSRAAITQNSAAAFTIHGTMRRARNADSPPGATAQSAASPPGGDQRQSRVAETA